MPYRIELQTGAIIPNPGCIVEEYNHALFREYMKDAQRWEMKGCSHMADVLYNHAKSLV